MKIFTLSLVISLLVGLSGCSNSSNVGTAEMDEFDRIDAESKSLMDGGNLRIKHMLSGCSI